ncbi:MAG: DUF2007 domain-containing protein [Oleiphilus sp.]|nr:MAG: DUF2007 domain-containing protein [Oleiphilus sp.]
MSSNLQRVFAHDNILLVHNIKNILEREGIHCELRNDLMSSAAGEVPPIEVWPEIRVDEHELSLARSIIEKALNGDLSATSWMCMTCMEDNAPAFELCWKCGQLRPH